MRMLKSHPTLVAVWVCFKCLTQKQLLHSASVESETEKRLTFESDARHAVWVAWQHAAVVEKALTISTAAT